MKGPARGGAGGARGGRAAPEGEGERGLSVEEGEEPGRRPDERGHRLEVTGGAADGSSAPRRRPPNRATATYSPDNVVAFATSVPTQIERPQICRFWRRKLPAVPVSGRPIQAGRSAAAWCRAVGAVTIAGLPRLALAAAPGRCSA